VSAAELFAHWQEVRRGLQRALELLTDEQLEFVPRAGLWSLGQVARHIASAEEGWFQYAVRRQLSAWPEYTAEAYPSVASIQAVLDEVHQRTLSYLAGVEVAGLEHAIDMPWNETIPLRWIVWHVLEHEVHHRGEIYLMLGLMGMEAPDV
jgi:uncharacterized damage-inducible protein DinB